MRQFTFVLELEEEPVDLVARELPPDANLDREALVHLNLLRDGSAVALAILRGDPEELEGVLDGHPDVRSYDVFNTGGETFHAHVHFEPAETVSRLLEIANEHRLTIDPPLKFVGDGLRVTVAGHQDDVREAAFAIPDNVSVTLERTTKYNPERDSLLDALTERQREVLVAALEAGYYEVPREATHQDVAERLDCSAGTVGEHLRKIQARVLTQLVG